MSKNPQKLMSYLLKQRTGEIMNWDTPQSLNEKIQWLKVYGDTSKWSQLADKYAVRNYIKEKGLDSILVKLYGHWDSVEDIEWEKLPNQFVLKVNNGSGDVLICKDKSSLDIESIKHKFSTLIQGYGILSGEPHYSTIKPCIIAEELLDVKKQSIESNSLIDYKVWCFDGKAEFFWTCYNRSTNGVETACYDLEWNFRPEWCAYTHHYKKANKLIPKPSNLDKLIEIAEILSEGFPEVRIDLYEVDEKPYFGEMTFTSVGGYMSCYSRDFLLELGKKVKLPLQKNK